MSLPAWYRPRRYLHFDEPVGYAKAYAMVKDPVAVAKHSFWPLITYQIKSSKISEDDYTGDLVPSSKTRDISYAAHGDSHILSFYCDQLGQQYEAAIVSAGLGDSVLAFRRLGMNNIDFAKQAFDEIRRQGNCTAIALDITKFFDNIDHALLKQGWKDLLGVRELPADHFVVFKALTKYSTVNRNDLFRTLGISIHNPRSSGRRRVCNPADFRAKVRTENMVSVNSDPFGIPQGTAISALLSNVYMMSFDAIAKDLASSVGGQYLRYCDDILFIAPTAAETRIKDFAEQEIKKIKLQVNPNKTDICHFSRVPGTDDLQADHPLQYLGFLFDGQRVLIRSAAFAKFSNRMKRGLSLAKQTMRSKNSIRTEKGELPRNLFLKKIYSRYSHLGGRNFLRYGYRAAEKMESTAIKRQLRPLWGRLRKAIERQ